MQAYKAYFEDGKFVPFETLELPKGSQAIVTVLEFSFSEETGNVNQRQKAALARFWEATKNSDPLPPEFDEVMKERINITRELDL